MGSLLTVTSIRYAQRTAKSCTQNLALYISRFLPSMICANRVLHLYWMFLDVISLLSQFRTSTGHCGWRVDISLIVYPRRYKFAVHDQRHLSENVGCYQGLMSKDVKPCLDVSLPHLPSFFPICTTSPSISISSPGNTGIRHVVLSVLVTPAISHCKFSRQESHFQD